MYIQTSPYSSQYVQRRILIIAINSIVSFASGMGMGMDTFRRRTAEREKGRIAACYAATLLSVT